MANLSPKQRFQLDPARTRAHLDFVDSSAVRASLDAALLQLSQRYATDVGERASLHFYRLQGAQDFISEWLALADIHERRDVTRTDELLDPELVPPLKPKKT